MVIFLKKQSHLSSGGSMFADNKSISVLPGTILIIHTANTSILNF